MIGASPPRHLCACARVHYAWVVAFVIFVALLLAGAVRSAPGILTVAYEEEFGWSRAEIAGAVSTNILLYGLLGPFAAALMEASGVRATLLAALTMLAAGAGVTVLMDRLWHLYALWGVVVGCAAGVIAPTLGKIVANRWFVARAGLVMGLFSASSSTGQVALAPAIGAALEARGWRAATLVVAGVAAAVMPLVALLVVDRPADIGVAAYGLVPAEEQEGAAEAGKAGAAVEDAAGDEAAAGKAGAAAAGAAVDAAPGAAGTAVAALVTAARGSLSSGTGVGGGFSMGFGTGFLAVGAFAAGTVTLEAGAFAGALGAGTADLGDEDFTGTGVDALRATVFTATVEVLTGGRATGISSQRVYAAAARGGCAFPLRKGRRQRVDERGGL
jgi:MFS family permease